MHTWPILWWGQSAAVVVYFGLCLVTAGRLRGRKEKRSADRIFWPIVILVWIRIFVPFVFGRGLAYRFFVVFLGIAASIGVLILVKALIAHSADGVRQT